MIGMIGGPVCYAGCQLKNWLLFDDSLDAFGLHAVGGVFGGIMVSTRTRLTCLIVCWLCLLLNVVLWCDVV